MSLLPALPQTKNRPRMRVLVGDPATVGIRINLSALAKGTLETRLAETSVDIFRQLEAWRPHIYLISEAFGAPVIDLIGQLRKRTNAPILLLNSSETAAKSARFLVAGADVVLTHPIADDLLLATTHAMLRRVYQYSLPPATPTQAAPTAEAPIAEAPAPQARAANYTVWPKCDECGYMGPRDRFEKRDKTGNSFIVCPTCNNNNIRIPIG